MVILKLTDEKAAALGLKTDADAMALLDLSAELQATNETLTKELAAEKEKPSMDADTTKRFEALDVRIDALEAEPEFDEEEIKAITDAAVAMSTENVMKIVAKVGANSLPDEGTPAEVTTEPEIAADDYEGQWKANTDNCHDEFSSLETYSAFKKAEAAGSVVINKRK